MLWSTGETTDTISVTTEGTYSVSIENICGTDQDSFNLMDYTPVSLDFLPTDTVICNSEELFWDLNSTDFTILEKDGSTSKQFYIFEPGTYTYQVFDLCTSTQRIMNVDLCDCEIFIPNTFTPNSDYLNEMFTPVLTCEPWKYRLDIWNRWGEMIFTTELYGRKWNGQFQGIDCPDGVYYYTVMYQYLPGYDRKEYSGAVNLLR